MKKRNKKKMQKPKQNNKKKIKKINLKIKIKIKTNHVILNNSKVTLKIEIVKIKILCNKMIQEINLKHNKDILNLINNLVGNQLVQIFSKQHQAIHHAIISKNHNQIIYLIKIQEADF